MPYTVSLHQQNYMLMQIRNSSSTQYSWWYSSKYHENSECSIRVFQETGLVHYDECKKVCTSWSSHSIPGNSISLIDTLSGIANLTNKNCRSVLFYREQYGKLLWVQDMMISGRCNRSTINLFIHFVQDVMMTCCHTEPTIYVSNGTNIALHFLSQFETAHSDLCGPVIHWFLWWSFVRLFSWSMRIRQHDALADIIYKALL